MQTQMTSPLVLDTIPQEVLNIVVYYSKSVSCCNLFQLKNSFQPVISNLLVKNTDEDDNYYRIVRACAKLGNFKIMKKFLKLGIKSHLDEFIIAAAAKGGQLEMCQWLKEQQLPCDSNLPMYAAIGNHLHIVKWAHENNISWNYLTFLRAIETNNLEFVKYLFENECPRNDKRSIEIALEKCDLDIVKYLHENGLSFPIDSLEYACGKGNIDVIQYCLDNGCLWTSLSLRVSARKDRLEVIKWAITKGGFLSKHVFSSAAIGGHIDVLQYLFDNKCPRVDNICIGNAARYGYLNVVIWMREHGFQWDVKTFELAAYRNNKKVLKYLYEGGCPWNEQTSSEIARYGPPDTLQWLFDSKCPFDKENICALAITYHTSDNLKCAYKNGGILTTQCFVNAISCGSLETSEWLLTHQCPWDEDVCNTAIMCTNISALKWLHAYGCPWNKEAYVYAKLIAQPCAKNAAIMLKERGYHTSPDNIEISNEIIKYLRDNNCPEV